MIGGGEAVCPRCGTRVPEGRLAACPRCLLAGADAEPVPLLATGIELHEEVGRGGMGEVWRGEHLRLGRPVAVKFLPERFSRDRELRARFEREARALAMLDHPRIVRVYDFGEDEGRPYLVMEYVEGRPASAAAPMPPRRAIEVAIDVCDALAAAHARGIVHRDVKPQNVLLDAEGRAKVSDFGVARIVTGDVTDWKITAPGIAVGTPAYMAPEALAGAPPDPRMDIYSLGATLYELLSGRPPAGDLVPLPPALDAIVRRALAAEPGRRYARVEDLRRDLEAALAQDARGASAELPAEERAWLRATAVVLTASSAVVLWALLLSMTPRVLRPDDVLPLIMVGAETLPDGRVASRARFETWPALAALAALAVAILAQGLFARYVRHAGLARPAPARPLPQARWVFAAGAVALAMYGARYVLEARGVPGTTYVPIFGGAILIAVLYLLWLSVLEAARTSRSLRREPLLWAGAGLALIPPVTEFLRYITAWRP